MSKRARSRTLVPIALAALLLTPCAAAPDDDAKPDAAEPKLKPSAQTSVQFYRKAALKVCAAIRVKLREYALPHYLIYTDMGDEEVKQWVKLLDDLYSRMHKLMGTKDKPLYQGRLVVFAFKKQKDWKRFERLFHGAKGAVESFAGIARHRQGVTYVAFAHHHDPHTTRGTLVHEAAHGIENLATGRGPNWPPSWLTEGLAVYFTHAVVGPSQSERQNLAAGHNYMRRNGAMGSWFWRGPVISGGNVGYAMAGDFFRFLAEHDPKGLRTFIRLVPTQRTTDEAFKKAFGKSRQALVTAYGRSIGIPHLKADG